MTVFTVSLFGHREINDLWHLNEKLAPIVKELLETKPFVSFLVGRNGEFDEHAASVIKRTQKEFGKENSDITLVLPYTVAKLEYYENYYDSIIIPESVYGAHPKKAITLKNRWMVERADLVIVYVERTEGGAYTAMKYAEKLNKKTINLCRKDAFSDG
ncbi:MAG: hypothetical protein J6K61_03455 [Clostridia bacterium]|nr:hypothetical protein [Clostridia bacterium]